MCTSAKKTQEPSRWIEEIVRVKIGRCERKQKQTPEQESQDKCTCDKVSRRCLMCKYFLKVWKTHVVAECMSQQRCHQVTCIKHKQLQCKTRLTVTHIIPINTKYTLCRFAGLWQWIKPLYAYIKTASNFLPLLIQQADKWWSLWTTLNSALKGTVSPIHEFIPCNQWIMPCLHSFSKESEYYLKNSTKDFPCTSI